MDLLSWARSAVAKYPRAADASVTVLVMIVVAAGLTIDGAPNDRQIDQFALLLVFVASAATFFRRTRPIPALAAATTLGFAYWVLDYPNGGAAFAIVVLLYSAAAHIDDRRSSSRVLIVFTVTLLTVLGLGYWWDGEDEVTIGLIVFNLIGFQLAWLVGDSVRHRRKRFEELEHQVKESKQQNREQTARALEAERARIARELHDTVAHSMSVVIVQAEGAQRLLKTNPDASEQALRVITDVARKNLADIRGTVAALRSHGEAHEDLAPTPTLSDVDQLIEQCRRSGLDVTMSVEGGKRELPTMVELSGYRILQESLTNTMKHGGPTAAADITIAYEPNALHIRVRDDGRGAASEPTPETAGHGIIGMRERVELFGGELAAGPLPGGGFGIDARIPAGPA